MSRGKREVQRLGGQAEAEKENQFFCHRGFCYPELRIFRLIGIPPFPTSWFFLRPFLPFSAPSALTLLSLAIGQLVSPSSTH